MAACLSLFTEMFQTFSTWASLAVVAHTGS